MFGGPGRKWPGPNTAQPPRRWGHSLLPLLVFRKVCCAGQMSSTAQNSAAVPRFMYYSTTKKGLKPESKQKTAHSLPPYWCPLLFRVVSLLFTQPRKQNPTLQGQRTGPAGDCRAGCRLEQSERKLHHFGTSWAPGHTQFEPTWITSGRVNRETRIAVFAVPCKCLFVLS